MAAYCNFTQKSPKEPQKGDFCPLKFMVAYLNFELVTDYGRGSSTNHVDRPKGEGVHEISI